MWCRCRVLALAVRVVEARYAVLRRCLPVCKRFCVLWSFCQRREPSKKVLRMFLLSGVCAGQNLEIDFDRSYLSCI